jgi:hypothetical protein
MDYNNQPVMDLKPDQPSPPSKNLILIGGAIVVILLVVAVFGYWYFYLRIEKSAFPTVTTENNPFASPTNAIQVLATSIDCNVETDQIAKDVCWQTKAVNEKNASFCQNIKTDTPFISKDACLNLTAQVKKDLNVCNLIKNPAIKTNCKEILND